HYWGERWLPDKGESWEGVLKGKERINLIDEEATLGDILTTEKGELLVGYLKGNKKLTLAKIKEKKKYIEIFEGKELFPPVLTLTENGEVYVVWSDEKANIYLTYSSKPYSKFQKHRVIVYGDGHQPAIISLKDEILIAYENFFSQIGYFWVRRNSIKENGIITSSIRFKGNICHSPKFMKDIYGRIWLFFLNSSRNLIFVSQWLGSNWTPPFPYKGIFKKSHRFERNFLPLDRFNIPRNSSTNLTPIYLGSSSESKKGDYNFFLLPLLRIVEKKPILFFDFKEINELKGLVLKINKGEKHHENPIFTPKKGGKNDERRVCSHCTVIKEGQLYRMWYEASSSFKHKVISKRFPVFPWWEQLYVCYAESEDGIHWQRKSVRKGIYGAPHCFNCFKKGATHPPIIFKDEYEKDHRKRYKFLHFCNSGEQRKLSYEGKYNLSETWIPGYLYTSGDGFKWKKQKIKIDFPGGKPISFVPICFFYDPDEKKKERKWKAYGFSSLTLTRRGGAVAFSENGINWSVYEENPILDPTSMCYPIDITGPSCQIHDIVVFRYSYYYLCFYQYQYGPDSHDIELAISRDGVHFIPLGEGFKMIEKGRPGEWDRGSISLSSYPVILKDKILLYYGGSNYYHESDGPYNVQKSNNMSVSLGLATWRKDGFSHLELKPGETEGYITTIPISPYPFKAVTLYINAFCNGGIIKTEIIDASTLKPIEGYTREECLPIKGNKLKHCVLWKKGDIVRIKNPFCLRFYFKKIIRTPKLYSFWWEKKGGKDE
ncbi:hypothetical protein J7K25_01180, partial [bacterium]|nr:hypothetical protein [bacterium]